MGRLREALLGKLTDEELSIVPRGFARIGDIAILNLPEWLLPKASTIAQALLELKGVRMVMLKESAVAGRHRVPKLRAIAGEGDTETVHREHGCAFKLDVARVMFSLGNLHERGRVAKLVRPGEVVVDLFAGIGQFTIPIAKLANPAKVHAIELNPVAYRYLLENVRINKVGHAVNPILGDCERAAPRDIADRVIMGILHVTHRYLPLAMEVLKPEGGVIHYHESVPSRLRFERPIKRILAAAGGREVEILGKRVVKRYAPGVDHVVIDAKIGRGPLPRT